MGGEAAEYDLCHQRRRRQRIDDGSHRNTGGAVGRKAIDAGRNRWKGDRCEAVLLAELNRTAIAGGEQTVLAERTAVPNWSDRVDHVSCREPVTLGDLGVTSLAAVKHPARGDKVRPRSAMNRAIDAAPTKERRIRGVDDGVNAQGGDVGNDDLEPRLADLAR